MADHVLVWPEVKDEDPLGDVVVAAEDVEAEWLGAFVDPVGFPLSLASFVQRGSTVAGSLPDALDRRMRFRP